MKMRRTVSSLIAALSALFAAPAALADWELNMPAGVTPLSQEIHTLHMLIFWVCVVIAVLVFGAMIYSIIAHTRKKNPDPAQFSHSTKAEIVWTVIPIAILVAMAIPAAQSLVNIEDTSNSDLSIKVTAYQWKWHYDYLDDGVKFFSSLDAASNAARKRDSGVDVFSVPNYLRNVDNPVVVPVDKKVRLLLTANDVIHAWWVPELGGKRDAIPGFVNQIWFKAEEIGVYRGQCAELCGRDHGFMPIVVDVRSEDDYQAWLSEQRGTQMAVAEQAVVDTNRVWGKDELMEHGEGVYTRTCLACHQANGQGLPAGGFPSLVGSAAVTGASADHLDIVLNGRAGTAMAAFGAQLSDADIAAVVTYERNSWGNTAGDVVQPADVQAARQ